MWGPNQIEQVLSAVSPNIQEIPITYDSKKSWKDGKKHTLSLAKSNEYL